MCESVNAATSRSSRRRARPDPRQQRPDRASQPRALPRTRRVGDQPDGIARRWEDRGSRSHRARLRGSPRASPRSPATSRPTAMRTAWRGRHPARNRSRPARHATSTRRSSTTRSTTSPSRDVDVALRRERRQPGLPGGLRPRPERQRRRAVGDGRGGQAAQVSGHVPEGRPRPDDEDRSAPASARVSLAADPGRRCRA